MGGPSSGKMEEVAIVRLNGSMVKKDGTEDRTKIFDYLEIDLDDYGDIEMSPQEAQHFMNHVRRMKTGVSAFIPMLCPGAIRCPMGTRCPLTQKWPVARACPIEVNYIKVQTREYIEGLGVDPDNVYEMTLVSKLVEFDLIDYRANIALAGDKDDGPGLLMHTRIEREDGGVMDMVVTHPLLDIKERIHKSRMQLLEQFSVTRKEQWKKAAALKQKQSSDVSNQLAKMRTTIEKMKKAANVKDLDKMIEEATTAATEDHIVEADWEVLDPKD